MKILLVVAQLGLGGAERQVLMLARGLGELQHTVKIAVFREGGAMQADPSARGVSISLLEGQGTLGRIASLRALLARERPDVVHGYLTAGNLASLCAWALPARPLIVWGMRASDMRMKNYGYKWQLASWFERCLIWLADLTIFNSQAGRSTFSAHRLSQDRIAVIENGLDLARFTPPGEAEALRRQQARKAWGCSAETLVIGHVARIDPMKNQHGFLKALAYLRQKRDGWKAVMIALGESERRARLQAEASELGLGELVVIAGPPVDITDAYIGFDLFCSSSAYGEGFSNVIAEAMACGLPVIATDVGDARRIIGSCGIVVPANHPKSLAVALCNGLAHRETLAIGAREQISPYDQHRLAERTVEALRQALMRLRR